MTIFWIISCCAIQPLGTRNIYIAELGWKQCSYKDGHNCGHDCEHIFVDHGTYKHGDVYICMNPVCWYNGLVYRITAITPLKKQRKRVSKEAQDMIWGVRLATLSKGKNEYPVRHWHWTIHQQPSTDGKNRSNAESNYCPSAHWCEQRNFDGFDLAPREKTRMPIRTCGMPIASHNVLLRQRLAAPTDKYMSH